MLKIFSLSAIIIGFLALFLIPTRKVSAQLCGGTASCSTALWQCVPNAFPGDNWDCIQYANSDSGSCSNRIVQGGATVCFACVLKDQVCYTDGVTYCYVTTDAVSSGLCGNTDQKSCTNGCYTYTPDCNTNVQCGGCYVPGNTNSCYNGDGARDCYYHSYSGGGSCNVTYAWTDYGVCTINNCNGGQGYFCSNGSCVRNCNSNPINCTACTGGSLPANTCGTANNGSQDCTWSRWNGQVGCIQQPDNGQVCNMFVDNCSNTFTCTNGNSCQTSFTIHVFTDLNHNGTEDAEDTGLAGVRVNINPATATGVTNITTDANGDVTFDNVTQGTYTITANIPANMLFSTANNFQVTVDSNNPGNKVLGKFGFTPVYTISGVICNDPEIDGSCVGDSDLPGNNSVIITPVTSDGTVVGSVAQATYKTPGAKVVSGTYTVSFAATNGYYFTASKAPNKVTPPFTISVGESSATDASGNKYTCSVPPAGTSDASCSNGSVVNLNFALSNLQSWWQGQCSDLRVETPGVDDPVPNTGLCGNVSNSFALVCSNNNAGTGIYYGGQNSPTFGFTGGSASFANYLVSSPYGSIFTPVSGINRASYDYLLDTANSAGLKVTDLSGDDPNTGLPYCGVGGVADCDLVANLPDGIYIVPSTVNGGNLTINLSRIIPNPGNFKSYIFLVSGKLSINSRILVPSTTDVVFAVKGDINVDPSVGETDVTSTVPDIEGLYSTEGDFWIFSNSAAFGSVCGIGGVSLDKRLNFLGAVVIGGILHNQRDLCSSDPCPTVCFGNCDGSGGGPTPTPTPGGLPTPTPTPGGVTRCLNDKQCSGGLTCNVSGNNCICSNGSNPGSCPLDKYPTPTPPGGVPTPTFTPTPTPGGTGTTCSSDANCVVGDACTLPVGNGPCTCKPGFLPGSCNITGPTPTPTPSSGSGGGGSICISDNDCQAAYACNVPPSGGTCTCGGGSRPGSCNGGIGSICSSDNDCQASLSCQSDAGGGPCTCGSGNRPGSCGSGNGPVGSPCTADSDCQASLACDSTGGLNGSCQPGNRPGTYGSGGQSGDRCVYDIDCQGNLSCNTAGGATCTCGASSRPGTCTLGNGGAGGTGSGFGSSGGGNNSGGTGSQCIYDVDCQYGFACNTAGGNSCVCGSGTRPGTCTLGDGGAAGGNGGNGGDYGQGDVVLQFLLNAPSFIKHKAQLWQEVAPVGN